ncbi:hypothetical protein PHET_06123 [Paragonimus heterotremus]|uniref:Uncharacterized protein n=1 Tax=Paragonimus heterotremus TaxID=100268 RepID=A0A8J4TEK6_9TREM|nr:hypothetical protein PHET_06123 [Paragonimus heterotremus]
MAKDSKLLGYPFVVSNNPVSLTNDYSAIMIRVPGLETITTIKPIRCASSHFKPRSVYSVYPPPVEYKPCPPPRVDPYNFSRTKPKTCVLETSDASNYIHNRANWMMQKEYQRYHNNWRCYYYGNPSEREQYGSYLRHGLKQQMSDNVARKKDEIKLKAKESQEIEQLCRKFDEKYALDSNRRKEFLVRFRDANKQMIEERAQTRRIERQRTIATEREQLRYNPINWSCTLK